jgi:3-hydroxyacyl-[acyl-carrier-protein] dehydratase
MASHAVFRYPARPQSPLSGATGFSGLPAPLFDISSIDLNAVALTTEQIEAINPHRGCMRQIDHVIWISANRSNGLGVKHVRHDEFWVPGHIPGRPIMPGVMLIEAGAQLCSLQYKLKTNEDKFVGFLRCDDVVFRSQVVPGDTLYLLGKEVEFRPRRFIAVCQGMVNNKIVFEGQVTGMTI